MFKFLVFGVIFSLHQSQCLGLVDSKRSIPINDKIMLNISSTDEDMTNKTFHLYCPTTDDLQPKPKCPDMVIPPGYTLLKGFGAYKPYPTMVNWHTARRTCENDGAHLIIVRSQQEYVAVMNLIKGKIVGPWWIGIHNLYDENHYVTVLDEPLSKITWSSYIIDHNKKADYHKVLSPFICKIEIIQPAC